MPDRIDKIKQQLINGKEYKALDALVDLLKSEKGGNELLNNVFLLQSRLDSIEAKFNQGITTYENWEVNRNKILKSTLIFLDKVKDTLALDDKPVIIDKGETQESISSNASFIHRLADPELVRRLAFYYLIFWIFLGALDSLVFQVEDASLVKSYSFLGIEFNTYVPDDHIVTWLKDFIGHLFAFGTAILAIILGIVKNNLTQTSTLVINKVNDYYKKHFFIYIILVIGFIAATIFFNAQYTTKESSISLWSAKISNSFLPPFIAGNYFILVMIPLILTIFYYFILLNISIREFKSFSSYNPFHGDKSFGLLMIGRSIFWSTLSFVIVMLMALVLQLILKNGELTFGIFMGTFLFMNLVWFGAIKPLRQLSTNLKIEKDRLYESVKEEVRSNNRMLGSQSNAEDLNTVKLLLDASRDNERELLELSVLPIKQNELLIGGVLILFLLGTIVYQII